MGGESSKLSILSTIVQNLSIDMGCCWGVLYATNRELHNRRHGGHGFYTPFTRTPLSQPRSPLPAGYDKHIWGIQGCARAEDPWNGPLTNLLVLLEHTDPSRGAFLSGTRDASSSTRLQIRESSLSREVHLTRFAQLLPRRSCSSYDPRKH